MSIRQGNNIIAGTPALKTINGESIVGSGDIEVGKTSYTPPLLSCMWSDHLLNDIQWLRADTFSWQDGNVYKAVYDELEAEYNDWFATHNWETDHESDPVSGMWFLTSRNGYKITIGSAEQEVTNIYNNTGVAWYYILDIENKRFKLPRTKFGFTGLRDTVGNYVSAGLPNITGSVLGANHSLNVGYGGYRGAIYDPGLKQGASTAGNSGNDWKGSWAIDASRSNSIYGNSNTVQPPATQMYLYFYVGNFTKTAIENTAGLNAEMFNDMATKSMFQVVDELPASPVAGVFYYVREI